jgi:rhodanese-related sulfurtransferase
MFPQDIKWQVLPLFLILVLAITACGGQPNASASTVKVDASEPLNLPVDIDVSAVEQLRSRDDVVLIDVRKDFEYIAGHIPGAVLIPLGQIPDRLDEIPQDKTVVAVCRSGNRSSQATNFLRQQGFDNIHNMQGGMIAWSQAGYEIEK